MSFDVQHPISSKAAEAVPCIWLTIHSSAGSREALGQISTPEVIVSLLPGFEAIWIF